MHSGWKHSIVRLSYIKRGRSPHRMSTHTPLWLYIVLGTTALIAVMGAAPPMISGSFADLPACDAEIPDELKGRVTLCPVPTIISITCLGVNEDTCRQNQSIKLIAGQHAVVSGTAVDFLDNPIPNAKVAIYAKDSNFFGRGMMQLVGSSEVTDGRYTADIVLPNLTRVHLLAAMEGNEIYAASNSSSQTSRVRFEGPVDVIVGTEVSYLAQLLIAEDDLSPDSYNLLLTIDRIDGTGAIFTPIVQEVQLNDDLTAFFNHRFDEPGTYKIRVEFDGEEYYQPNLSELEVNVRYPVEIVLPEPAILDSTNYELRGKVEINGLPPQAFPELASHTLAVSVMALHAKKYNEAIISPGPDGKFIWSLTDIPEGRTTWRASLIETPLVKAAEDSTYSILRREVLISLGGSLQDDLQSNHPYEFSGVVTDTDGNGIGGVNLSIFFLDTPEGVLKAMTDDTGAFKVLHTPEGEGEKRIHIEARSESIRPTTMQWSFQVVTPRVLEPEKNRREVEQGKRLEIEGSLVIKGTPLAGEVLHLLVNGSGKIGETTTDGEGRFSFSVKPTELSLEDGIYQAVYFVPAFDESIDSSPFRVYSGSNSVWFIVGGILGGLTLFVLLALVFYYSYRRYPTVWNRMRTFGRYLPSSIKAPLVIQSTRKNVKEALPRLSIGLRSTYIDRIEGYSLPVFGIEDEIEVEVKVAEISEERVLPDSIVFHLIVQGKFRSKARRCSEVLLRNGTAHAVIRPDRTGCFEIRAAYKDDADYEATETSISVMVIHYRDEISSLYSRFRRLYLRPSGPVPRSASPREMEQILVREGLVEDQQSLSLLVTLVQQADFSRYPVKRSAYIQALAAVKRLSAKPDEEQPIAASVIKGAFPTTE